MKKILLRGKYGEGKYTTVSDSDFDLLSTFNWYVSKDNKTESLLYVFRIEKADRRGLKVSEMKRPEKIFMHRQILGDRDGFYVDHINRNTLDNRRSNLRHLTPQLSVLNRTPYDTILKGKPTGKGLGYTKVGLKYQAQAGGKYLGTYKSEDEAHAVYVNYIKNIKGY